MFFDVIRPKTQDPIKGDTCLALYDYIDNSQDRLQFVKGEEILLDDLHDGGWAYGESLTSKKMGYFPLKYVTKKTQQPQPKQQLPFVAPLPPPLTSVSASPVSSPPNMFHAPLSPPPPALPLPSPISPSNRHLSSPPPTSPTNNNNNNNNQQNQGVPLSPTRAISPPFGFLGGGGGGGGKGKRERTTTSPQAISPPSRKTSPPSSGGTIGRIRASQSFSFKLDEAGGVPSYFTSSSGPKYKHQKYPHRRPMSVLDPQAGAPPPGGSRGKVRRASVSMYGVPISDLDCESIVNNKKQTRNVLDNWLKTRRPDMEELQKRGILSTDGNIDGIQFAKKNLVKSSKKELIGMSLDELLEAVPGRDIPFVVDQCVTYIRRNAMTLHGVFRVSPNQQELSKLKALYKSPLEVIDLEKKVKDPHVVAGLLKLFLSSLPDPLFPCTLYSPLIDSFGSLYDQEDPQPLIKEYKILLKLIPKAHAPLVQFLFEFLEELQQQSEKNMMTPSNLGIVFGPNLLKPSVQTQDSMLNMTNRDVVSFLVSHYKEIWGVE